MKVENIGTNIDSIKMQNLVEITSIVTESTDFYAIKDKIVEKMLEVVDPTKACVNLFYDGDDHNAYLVCSRTLKYIPTVFDTSSKAGAKVDFDEYSDYIHEAVDKKKIIYIKNVFDDESAQKDRDIAREEGYVGRIVFPLTVDGKVVGFMTCFLSEDDRIQEEDIDFIASVASLLSLSIEITNKNNAMRRLINKFRVAITYINDATKKLYKNKSIREFLDILSVQACNITNSKEALIILDSHDNIPHSISSHNMMDESKSNIYPVINKIMGKKLPGGFVNEVKSENFIKIDRYIYYKLQNKGEVIGCIVCANSNNYTNDDLNILRILSSQVAVAMQLYEYNEHERKHQLLDKELNLLSKQQQLIMDGGKMECNSKKELYFYHKPAKVVGGDFYHAIRNADNNVVYIVADVMGHGMVSNYVVAMIKGTFKALANHFKSPAEILTRINSILFDEFDKMGVFTTCVVGILNTEENILTVANAGHYNPIVIREDGTVVEDIEFIKGIPIGIMKDATYGENSFEVGDLPLICTFTDGLIEIKNKEKEEFGIKRFADFLQKNYKLSQESIVDNLKLELEGFSPKENYDDDILVVMLKDM
ncbi:MAG: SpoIIE family protein phosphatase [Clostridioides sp.]|jgi:serine phosphatase RsbU (regulator of sigma subunit)|nr:SpoIIE family protein phosphatase [Clostridioides sp.]